MVYKWRKHQTYKIQMWGSVLKRQSTDSAERGESEKGYNLYG